MGLSSYILDWLEEIEMENDSHTATTPKFKIGTRVLHLKTATVYTIIHTPDNARLEDGNLPAYIYSMNLHYNTIWCRSQKEMEDGRFVVFNG